MPYVGFGTAFLDYDNDGDLDLTVANGDVIDNVKLLRDTSSYEQLNLLLRNDGTGKFTSVGPSSGPGFALKKASRALAVGDLDNDGDLDIVVANVDETADVLQNDGGNRGNSILVRTIGSTSNRDGIGARLKFSVGGKILCGRSKRDRAIWRRTICGSTSDWETRCRPIAWKFAGPAAPSTRSKVSKPIKSSPFGKALALQHGSRLGNRPSPTV